MQDLFQRNSPSSSSHRDSFRDKMDALTGETETAFLIEKTNHQSFVSVLVGVVLTGQTPPPLSPPWPAVPPVDNSRHFIHGTAPSQTSRLHLQPELQNGGGKTVMCCDCDCDDLIVILRDCDCYYVWPDCEVFRSVWRVGPSPCPQVRMSGLSPPTPCCAQQLPSLSSRPSPWSGRPSSSSPSSRASW